MENSIDFIELANYCKNEKSASCDNKRKWYGKTFYAAIFEDDGMVVSTTPHILKNAKERFFSAGIHVEKMPFLLNQCLKKIWDYLTIKN